MLKAARRHPVDVSRPSPFPFWQPRDEAVRQRAREIMTKSHSRRATRGSHHQLAGCDVYYEEHIEHPATFRRKGLAWSGRTGCGCAEGDAGGGDHGYRVYELHQQVEKWDEMLSSPWFYIRRRQPQRTGNDVTAELKLS